MENWATFDFYIWSHCTPYSIRSSELSLLRSLVRSFVRAFHIPLTQSVTCSNKVWLSRSQHLFGGSGVGFLLSSDGPRNWFAQRESRAERKQQQPVKTCGALNLKVVNPFSDLEWESGLTFSLSLSLKLDGESEDYGESAPKEEWSRVRLHVPSAGDLEWWC